MLEEMSGALRHILLEIFVSVVPRNTCSTGQLDHASDKTHWLILASQHRRCGLQKVCREHDLCRSEVPCGYVGAAREFLRP